MPRMVVAAAVVEGRPWEPGVLGARVAVGGPLVPWVGRGRREEQAMACLCATQPAAKATPKRIP